MTADLVLRHVGQALIAARVDLNAADPGTATPLLGDAVATIGDTLIDVAPGVRGLPAPDAMRRVGTAIEARTASAVGVVLAVGLAEGAASFVVDPAAEPLDVVARGARAVTDALARRPTANADAAALLLALASATDALEAASASDVSAAEGFSLAMLSVFETIDGLDGLPSGAAVALAIALRAAAEALA